MPSQPVVFKMPAKGVMKNPSFNDAPIDAAVDAVNVFPWDRTSRFRIGQRSGTSKLFASALSANHTVQALEQTTTALDPSTVVANVVLTNEHFTYADGNLATVSSSVWTNPINTHTANFVSAFPIVSDEIKITTSGSGAGSAALLTTSPTIGSAYITKAKFKFATLLSGQRVFLTFRVDSAHVSTTGFNLGCQLGGADGSGTIFITYSGAFLGSFDFAAGTIPANTYFTLELHVNGNTFSGWINGVQLLSYDADGTDASHSGVGFGVTSNSSPTGNTFSVDDFEVLSAVPPANFRQTNLVAVCGGNIYQGTLADISLATSGSGALSDTSIPGVAFATGVVFLVDGAALKTLNLTTRAVTDLTATAGTLPSGCTLATVWRDRLVLAAPRDNPQNFFFSRVGTQTDFDYSQLDTAAAFAGNASTAGRIGEPIVALIPFTEDKLLIAGDHNLWMVTGDPADGGTIDLVSDAIGTLGAKAWTKAPDGTIYMVGTGGLYRFPPGSSAPENISSGKWNDYFASINRAGQYVVMTYDRDRQAAYVFVTSVVSGTVGDIHLLWDARTESLWPVQFPLSHGPICTLVYDGDGPDDRTLLLGTRNGFIQKLDAAAPDDDGTAISSYIYLGPVKASNIGDSVVEALDLVFGEPPPGFTEADWNVKVQVVAAPTTEKALNAPLYTRSRTFTGSRRPARWLQRTRGNSFFLKFSNASLGKTWSLESAQAQMIPTGLTRRR